MDHRQEDTRIGSISAMSGTVLLMLGTYLHPSNADPHDAQAAFAEYASDRWWVTSHLTQFLGVVLIVGALVLLSRRMGKGPAAEWALLGAAGAVSCLAATVVLQAVDGIALKAMVDLWAAAQHPDKAVLFQAALSVRQIEIGLASITSVLLGLTVSVYGIACLVDRRWPKWSGLVGILSGGLTLLAGVVTALMGFSAVTMAVSMPSNILLLGWIVGVGAVMWPSERKGSGRQ
jgi:Domain of unknown function (DUF4386)